MPAWRSSPERGLRASSHNGLNAIAAAVLDAQKALRRGRGGRRRRCAAAAARPACAPRASCARNCGRCRCRTRARFEIEFRLRQKEREFQQAVLLANGVRIDALADDGVVVPGQPVRLSIVLSNHGATPLNVRQVGVEGFNGNAACTLTAPAPGGRGGAPAAQPGGPPLTALAKDQVGRCDLALTVPEDTRVSEPYWHRQGEAGRYVFDDDAPFGLPYRPTPFYVQATLSLGPNTSEVFAALPVQFRYEGDIFSGEKRSSLLVVPALSVRVTPEVTIVPSAPPAPAAAPPQPTTGRGRGAAPAPAPPRPPAAGRGRGAAAPTPPPAPETSDMREVRVNVVNDTKGEVESVVTLEVPAGWTATPAEQKVAFTREDESQTVRFQLRAPRDAAPGEYAVSARASVGAATYNRGYQMIEYPHTTRQHIFHAAATRLKVMDVRTTPNLTVGYIMGVGDEVPAAIDAARRARRIPAGGRSCLGRPVAVPGDRDRRACLRAPCRSPREQRAAARLRAERRALVVQYNKFEFNAAQYGPHAAKVTSDRVTDENAPVRILEPADPLLTTPEQDHGRGVAGMGPGARAVLPRRARLQVPRSRRARGSVPVQCRRETRCARRCQLRQGPLDLRRPRAVARAAGRRRRRVSAARQSDQPEVMRGPWSSARARPAQRRRGSSPRAGVTVRLLDRSKFPRNKPCGGGISLRVLQRFPYLEQALARIRDAPGVAALSRRSGRRFDGHRFAPAGGVDDPAGRVRRAAGAAGVRSRRGVDRQASTSLQAVAGRQRRHA